MCKHSGGIMHLGGRPREPCCVDGSAGRVALLPPVVGLRAVGRGFQPSRKGAAFGKPWEEAPRNASQDGSARGVALPKMAGEKGRANPSSLRPPKEDYGGVGPAEPCGPERAAFVRGTAAVSG